MNGGSPYLLKTGIFSDFYLRDFKIKTALLFDARGPDKAVTLALSQSDKFIQSIREVDGQRLRLDILCLSGGLNQRFIKLWSLVIGFLPTRAV